MNLLPVVLAASVVAALVVLFLLWRVRRTARTRLAERERGELEERVAARVRSISEPGVPEDETALRVPPREVVAAPLDARSADGVAPVVAAPMTEEPEPAAPDDGPPGEAARPRMVLIAAPDIDRIYARRRPVNAAAPVRSSGTAVEDRPRRRRRLLVPAAAVVLVFAVAVLGGGPVLRALVGTGAVATPTPTGVAALPTGTATPEITTSPPATASPGPTPTSGPTLEPTATPNAPPGGTPLPTPHVYVVRSGDTLWQIAQTFGITLDQLVSANPQIKDPGVILPGQQVTIPTPTPAP